MPHSQYSRTHPTATVLDGAVVLRFPFNGELIDGLKAIPAHARAYDPETRAWTIYGPYTERAIDLLRRFFPEAIVTSGRGRPIPSAAHAVLYLLPTAPREVVDAAYRALAKLHHPDRLPAPQRVAGTERMRAINVAYAELTEAAL